MTMISVTADSAMAVTAKVSLWKGDVGASTGEEDLIAIKKLMKGCYVSSNSRNGATSTTTAKVLSAKANESMVMGEGKMIMSARLISAGPRPGYTPILNDSSCPKGLPMLEASRIC